MPARTGQEYLEGLRQRQREIWLNGEQVYSTRAHDAAVPDKARVKVKLKKGVNTLLLKIVNGSNPHGFYLTLLSEQELKAGR